MPALLQVEAMSLRFGGVQALDRVSLEVAEGEVTGLIGPNGAGKTSLFNCLSRIYAPDRGTVTFDGRDLLAVRPPQVAELGIARTFQNVSVCHSMTVRDNVLLGAHHRGRAGFWSSGLRLASTRREDARTRAEVADVLDVLDLAAVAETPVDGLPYGTLKRVEIARALAARPRLVLLDEPAGGLSHSEVEVLAGLLRRLCAELALTLLLVDHHMRFVMSLSDRVWCMNFGRVIATGSPEEVQRDPAVVGAYLGAAP